MLCFAVALFLLRQTDLCILYTVHAFYVYASALHVLVSNNTALWSYLVYISINININIPHFIVLHVLYYEPLCCMF